MISSLNSLSKIGRFCYVCNNGFKLDTEIQITVSLGIHVFCLNVTEDFGQY